MAESTYHINLAVSSGDWTPDVRRAGDAATGGSTLTVPWVENANSGTGDTTSKKLGIAALAALRACLNDRAANGDPSTNYTIQLANDGSGNYDPTVRKDATPAANGTALTIPWVENSNSGSGDTTSKNPATACLAALRAAENDRAAGN